MSTMVMHRDHGKPTPYIFKIRHNDDVADENLDIRDINALLEDAPHPKMRHWIVEHLGDKAYEVMEHLQLDEGVKALPFHQMDHDKKIEDYIEAQSQYNALFEHAQAVSQIVVMMHALQKGVRTGIFPGEMNNYARAHEEYPQKYRMLLEGLSPASLATLRDWEVGWTFRGVNSELAQVVHENVLEDKAALHKEVTGAVTHDALKKLREKLHGQNPNLN